MYTNVKVKLSKKDFDTIKEISERESSFDWDIPSGYIMFGKYGMTVCRLCRKIWYTKYVSEWKSKSYKDIMEELDEQEWREIA